MELMSLLLVISLSITFVSVLRWRDAEAKLKLLRPDGDGSVFEIVKEFTPDYELKKCTVFIHQRKGIPAIADMTGISVAELADIFDEAEKNGKPCIIETKDFKA